MQIYIPSWVIIPLYIVSFLLQFFQYYRIDPARRVLNPQFALMTGALVLMFTVIMLGNKSLSLIFFFLALLWLGLSIYLLRRPKH